MVTLENITNADWQMSIADVGEVVQGLNDIQQCLQILLSTQKGTVVFRPNFGIDLLFYIDKPINLVKADLTREIIDQVEIYEPRAIIDQVDATIEESSLLITVTWSSNQGNGTNVIRYNTTT